MLQIRLAEARLQGNQQNMKPEQLEKMEKMEGWLEELKLLEDRNANLVSWAALDELVAKILIPTGWVPFHEILHGLYAHFSRGCS